MACERVIFNLLDLLERYGVRATCFVPGFEAATRPWLLEAWLRAVMKSACTAGIMKLWRI